jgi:hypothetical protein
VSSALARGLLRVVVVRGVQWWNSSWDIRDPDALVWTNRRSLRRARLLRQAAYAFVVALGAAAGTVAALVVTGHVIGH